MGIINEKWLDYYDTVLRPAGIPLGSVQLIETRRAFYAAFFSSLTWMRDEIGPDKCSEDQGVDMLQQAYDEAIAFYKTIGKNGT